MTRKRIIITQCFDCPHIDPCDFSPNVCGLDDSGREVRGDEIPGWCQLEDA
jgi:hypothetical protein